MFIPASTLKRRYLVKGRFYRIKYQSQNIIRCRSTLEIFVRQNHVQSSFEPDAYVIMENPGGSESLEVTAGHIDGPIYLSTDVNLASQIERTPLTNAKPDRTQYQIMRLMSNYNWNHVRVLNLSDIRTTSSTDLIETYMELGDHHLSVFSDVRNSERSLKLQVSANKPVIAAWGTSEGLRHLAGMALSKLPDNVKGLQGNKPYKFLHPLPKYGKPRQWLEDFINEVSF
ncbi:DUF1643 domain-containing protein [Paenibacillus vini]|uniref:DUF1643 domain-containing protein n=1 Tax=Paenibacillus vini TaxID=1476024 RepID=UPI0025B72B23|nr:DUF1643 domain-containing protein [Paenibacillus vini]MDN4070904.1 DUF1643 domain-containing protein [Paenibacillus vini]